MIWTILNLPNLGMLPQKFQILSKLVFEKKILKIFLYIILCKSLTCLSLWPNPTPGDHNWTYLNFIHYLMMLSNMWLIVFLKTLWLKWAKKKFYISFTVSFNSSSLAKGFVPPWLEAEWMKTLHQPRVFSCWSKSLGNQRCH